MAASCHLEKNYWIRLGWVLDLLEHRRHGGWSDMRRIDARPAPDLRGSTSDRGHLERALNVGVHLISRH